MLSKFLNLKDSELKNELLQDIESKTTAYQKKIKTWSGRWYKTRLDNKIKYLKILHEALQAQEETKLIETIIAIQQQHPDLYQKAIKGRDSKMKSFLMEIRRTACFHFILLPEQEFSVFTASGFGGVLKQRARYYKRTFSVVVKFKYNSQTSLEFFNELNALKAEGEIHQALNGHANITNFFDFYWVRIFDTIILALIIELMSMSLHNIIVGKQKEQNVIDKQDFKMMQGIASGVDHMHKLGFVHRNLKPSNILIDAKGVTKLADFSCATRINDAKAKSAYFTTWSSPKVAQAWLKTCSLDYDCTDDVFSLTMILWAIASRKTDSFITFFSVGLALFPDHKEKKSVINNISLQKQTPAVFSDNEKSILAEKLSILAKKLPKDQINECLNLIEKNHTREPMSNKHIPQDLQNLIRKGWHSTAEDRPNAHVIKQTLEVLTDKTCETSRINFFCPSAEPEKKENDRSLRNLVSSI